MSGEPEDFSRPWAREERSGETPFDDPALGKLSRSISQGSNFEIELNKMAESLKSQKEALEIGGGDQNYQNRAGIGEIGGIGGDDDRLKLSLDSKSERPLASSQAFHPDFVSYGDDGFAKKKAGLDLEDKTSRIPSTREAYNIGFENEGRYKKEPDDPMRALREAREARSKERIMTSNIRREAIFEENVESVNNIVNSGYKNQRLERKSSSKGRRLLGPGTDNFERDTRSRSRENQISSKLQQSREKFRSKEKYSKQSRSREPLENKDRDHRRPQEYPSYSREVRDKRSQEIVKNQLKSDIYASSEKDRPAFQILERIRKERREISPEINPNPSNNYSHPRREQFRQKSKDSISKGQNILESYLGTSQAPPPVSSTNRTYKNIGGLLEKDPVSSLGKNLIENFGGNPRAEDRVNKPLLPFPNNPEDPLYIPPESDSLSKPPSKITASEIREKAGYVNYTLKAYNMGQIGRFESLQDSDPLLQDLYTTFEALNELLKLRGNELKVRTKLKERIAKAESDCKNLDKKVSRMKDQLLDKDKKIGEMENLMYKNNNEAKKVINHNKVQLNSNKALKSISNLTSAQYEHELKKKDLEIHKLKETVKRSALLHKDKIDNNTRYSRFEVNNFYDGLEKDFNLLDARKAEIYNGFREEAGELRGVLYTVYEQLFTILERSAQKSLGNGGGPDRGLDFLLKREIINKPVSQAKEEIHMCFLQLFNDVRRLISQ